MILQPTQQSNCSHRGRSSVKHLRRWGLAGITFILKALLKPLAKKPPKGPMRDAKDERKMLWIWKGYMLTRFWRRKATDIFFKKLGFELFLLLNRRILTSPRVFWSRAGTVYSCITKMSEGSHSTVNPLVSLLKPTGHTKYWNWDSR